eukprot:2314348-Ditylum_brightwellii.AAC.1
MQAATSEAASSQAASKNYTHTNETYIMKVEIVDEPVVYASHQDRALVDDIPPVEVMDVDGTHQDDDEVSWQIVSNLSLSKEPFSDVEVSQLNNEEYFRHFFNHHQILMNVHIFLQKQGVDIGFPYLMN